METFVTPEMTPFVKLLFAILGWAIWNSGKFVLDKDEYDDRNEAFPFSEYWKKNWDNIAFSFLFVFLALTGADFLGVVNVFHDTKLEWTNGFYLLPGPASQWALTKIREYRKKST